MKPKATTALAWAPAQWQAKVDRMTDLERQQLIREIDGIACRAAELGGYLADRYGYGGSDRGHKAAVKQANKQGRAVWMKALGYNAYHGLHI